MAFGAVVAAVAVTSGSQVAPVSGQAGCDGGPPMASWSAPIGFVQPPPWAWSVSVEVSGFEPACGDRVVLEAAPIGLGPEGWGSGGASTFDYEDDAVVCAEGCPHLVGKAEEAVVPIVGDRGVVAVPASVGPGLVQISVRVDRDGEHGSSGGGRTMLLTSSTFDRADEVARTRMLDHADASAAIGDEDGAERLRALAASSRQYLRYEPAPGGDRLVTAFGDLVGADQVAVSVPGFSSAVGEGYEVRRNCLSTRTARPGETTIAQSDPCVLSRTWLGNAERLWRRAAARARAERTAVIAYLGYDAPELRDVYFADDAFDGAATLAQDLEAWGFTGTGAERLVLVGHSYGSLLVGLAAGQGGVAARDLVFLGSPGVGVEVDASHPGARPLPQRKTPDSREVCPGLLPPSCFERVASGHTWVARFEQDPIPTQARNFGMAPTADEFGAIEYETEPPDCERALGGVIIVDWTCHSRYFDWGQAALDNTARVAAGLYDDVEVQDRTSVTVPPSIEGGGRRRWPSVPDFVAAVDASGADTTCRAVELDPRVTSGRAVSCVAAAPADLDGDGADDDRIVVGRTGPEAAVACLVLDALVAPCTDLPEVDDRGDMIISEVADVDDDGADDAVVRVGYGANTAIHDMVTFDGRGPVVPDLPLVTLGSVRHADGYSCADADGDGRGDLLLTGWSDPSGTPGTFDVFTTRVAVHRWEGKEPVATWVLEDRVTGGPAAADASPHAQVGCEAHGFDGIAAGLPPAPTSADEAARQFLDSWRGGDVRGMRAVARADGDPLVDPVERALAFPQGEVPDTIDRCDVITVTEPTRTLGSCALATPSGLQGFLETEDGDGPGGHKVVLLSFGGE